MGYDYSYSGSSSGSGKYNSLYSQWDDFLQDGSNQSPYSSLISGYANKLGGLGKGKNGPMSLLNDAFGMIKQVQELEQQIAEMVYNAEKAKQKTQGGNRQYNDPTTSGGKNTVDVNNDGKADIKIEGMNAEELADYIRQMTQDNPEIAQLFLEGGKLNEDGMYHIDIKDLGGNIAGLAGVGQKGEGVMDHGHMAIDDQWKAGGMEQLVHTIVHELGHNAGFGHGDSHERWIDNILH